MSLFSAKVHRYIYVGGIASTAMFLSFPHILISLSQFVLFFNWLAEGNFQQKIQRLKNNKALHVFLLMYMVHVLGMFYSENLNYGLADLRIKLPLFILPIFLASSEPLTFKELRIVLLLFIGAVSVASFIDIAAYYQLFEYKYTDIREITIFVSHIRFALLILLSISFLLNLSFGIYNKQLSGWGKILSGFVIIWFLFFLYIIQSVTGFSILILGLFIWSVYAVLKINSLKYKLILVTFNLLLLAIPSWFIGVQIYQFYTPKPKQVLHTTTPSGNAYTHNPNHYLLENGHKVWVNVCQKELKEEWNKVSVIDYDSVDRLGYPIKHTLIRYLTSLGLNKDKEAIAKLSETDISNIEKSIANYRFSQRKMLDTRMYQIIWELHNYFHGGNPSGHSVAQRFEYLHNSVALIKENFWFGVGTGDVVDEILQYYEKTNSRLDKKWRLRSHNQYATFLIGFGFLGFVVICYAIIYPIYLHRKKLSIFFYAFLTIAVLSMVSEDTLETQVGVTFFSLFYSLFMFSYHINPQLRSKNNNKNKMLQL